MKMKEELKTIFEWGMFIIGVSFLIIMVIITLNMSSTKFTFDCESKGFGYYRCEVINPTKWNVKFGINAVTECYGYDKDELVKCANSVWMQGNCKNMDAYMYLLDTGYVLTEKGDCWPTIKEEMVRQ
jgi:hypothetical protein